MGETRTSKEGRVFKGLAVTAGALALLWGASLVTQDTASSAETGVKGPSGPYYKLIPGSSQGSSSATIPFSSNQVTPGTRVLRVNQKVLAMECRINPRACICPAGSPKVQFFEEAGRNQLMQKKLICLPPGGCPAGQMMRQSQNNHTGNYLIQCEGMPK